MVSDQNMITPHAGRIRNTLSDFAYNWYILSFSVGDHPRIGIRLRLEIYWPSIYFSYVVFHAEFRTFSAFFDGPCRYFPQKIPQIHWLKRFNGTLSWKGYTPFICATMLHSLQRWVGFLRKVVSWTFRFLRNLFLTWAEEILLVVSYLAWPLLPVNTS